MERTDGGLVEYCLQEFGRMNSLAMATLVAVVLVVLGLAPTMATLIAVLVEAHSCVRSELRVLRCTDPTLHSVVSA